MDSYNKKNIKIAAIITELSVAAGFLGWWFTRNALFIDIVAIPVGIVAISFSRDLAMEGVVKYKLNYKFYRGMYVFIGIAFIAIGIYTLLSH